MPLKETVVITQATTVYSTLFQCELWVANTLIQITEPYIPGIKQIFKRQPSYRMIGKALGTHFWFISCIKHPTNRIPQEIRDWFLLFTDLNKHLIEIQKSLINITTQPIYQSIEYFRAFTSALNRPFLDKRGAPTKPLPNEALYIFMIRNRETINSLKSVKKIHEWLLRESRFNPTEANFRKMCSRLGLCFKKN